MTIAAVPEAPVAIIVLSPTEYMQRLTAQVQRQRGGRRRPLQVRQIDRPHVRSGSTAACCFLDFDAGQLTFRAVLHKVSDEFLTTIANNQIIRS